jgi:hypothetical protein
MNRRRLAHRSDRSAPVLRVSRFAQRSLTLWPACWLPEGAISRSSSAQVVASLNRSRCYRLERPVTGRESNPLKMHAFSRRTDRSAQGEFSNGRDRLGLAAIAAAPYEDLLSRQGSCGTAGARSAGRPVRHAPLFLRPEPPTGRGRAGNLAAGCRPCLGRCESLALPAHRGRLFFCDFRCNRSLIYAL